MKTRKSNKLIDKLRAAWKDAPEGERSQIAALAERLTAVHQDVIAFLQSKQDPKTTPF